MKLYSWIQNENHKGKTQGGNKALGITLEYEENGQDWRCNPLEHSLYINFRLDEKGIPVLFINGNKSFQVIDKR